MVDTKHIKIIIYSNGKMTIKARPGIDPTRLEIMHDEMLKCLDEVRTYLGAEVNFKVTLETGKKPEIETKGLLSPEKVEYVAKTFKNCFDKLNGVGRVG